MKIFQPYIQHSNLVLMLFLEQSQNTETQEQAEPHDMAEVKRQQKFDRSNLFKLRKRVKC